MTTIYGGISVSSDGSDLPGPYDASSGQSTMPSPSNPTSSKTQPTISNETPTQNTQSDADTSGTEFPWGSLDSPNYHDTMENYAKMGRNLPSPENTSQQIAYTPPQAGFSYYGTQKRETQTFPQNKNAYSTTPTRYNDATAPHPFSAYGNVHNKINPTYFEHSNNSLNGNGLNSTNPFLNPKPFESKSNPLGGNITPNTLLHAARFTGGLPNIGIGMPSNTNSGNTREQNMNTNRTLQAGATYHQEQEFDATPLKQPKPIQHPISHNHPKNIYHPGTIDLSHGGNLCHPNNLSKPTFTNFGIDNPTAVVYGFHNGPSEEFFDNKPRTQGTILKLSGIKALPYGWRRTDLVHGCYPDVTRNMEIYLRHIKQEIEKIPYSNDPLAFFKTFYNFKTNGSFDLKGQLGIPKRREWVIYKGQLVTDAYLANMAFGYACAVQGLTLSTTLSDAQGYSLISNGQFDQPEDQAAVISGYYEKRYQTPWPKELEKPIYYEKLKKENPALYKLEGSTFLAHPKIMKLIIMSAF